MVIIGLLMALVGPNLIGRSEKAKTQAAAMQIERLGTVLDTFRLDVGRYPTTQEGLQALVQRPSGLERWDGPYLNKGVPKDPWDRPYYVPQPRRRRAPVRPLLARRRRRARRRQDTNRDVTSWGGDNG